MMQHSESHKTERIGIRTTPEIKQFLKKAADAYHLNVTDFLIQNGLQAARQVLTDRKIFSLSENDWSAFLTALDQPVQEKTALKKLLSAPSIFET